MYRQYCYYLAYGLLPILLLPCPVCLLISSDGEKAEVMDEHRGTEQLMKSFLSLDAALSMEGQCK